MEALGWLSEVRYRPEDPERAFFSSRFTRVLDGLGEAGWSKALKLEAYAACGPTRPQPLQQALCPYAEAF